MADQAPWEKHKESVGEAVPGQSAAPWEKHVSPSITPEAENFLSDLTPEDAFRIVDDFMRSVASGVTFGFADDLAAAANTITGLGEESFAENQSAERARDAAIDPTLRLSGEAVGAAASGAGLARGGFTLLNMARPTVGKMAAAGAVEGALFGAAHGAGQATGGPEEQLVAAGQSAVTGAALGGVTGAGAGVLAKATGPKPPTVKQLKAAAVVQKNLATGSGVTLTEEGFDKITKNMVKEAKDFGFRPALYPKVAKILKEFQKEQGKPVSLAILEELRKVLRAAGGSKNKEERLLGRILRDRFMGDLTELSASDVTGMAGDAVDSLKQYIALWARARKGEIVEGLIASAKDRASQFSGSGLENALRTEFRKLATNPIKMRGFSEAEQQAIHKVVQGGPIANVLRMIGKAAPTGIVSGSLGPGVGFMVAGPAGAVAVPAAGLAGRAGATVVTGASARSAAELMRAGGTPPVTPSLTPVQVRILQGLIAAEASVTATRE